jgi:glutamine synthetase
LFIMKERILRAKEETGYDELEGVLAEGMGFDGSSIQGFARIDESDMVALPDASIFAPDRNIREGPRRPKEQG